MIYDVGRSRSSGIGNWFRDVLRIKLFSVSSKKWLVAGLPAYSVDFSIFRWLAAVEHVALSLVVLRPVY